MAAGIGGFGGGGFGGIGGAGGASPSNFGFDYSQLLPLIQKWFAGVPGMGTNQPRSTAIGPATGGPLAQPRSTPIGPATGGPIGNQPPRLNQPRSTAIGPALGGQLNQPRSAPVGPATGGTLGGTNSVGNYLMTPQGQQMMQRLQAMASGTMTGGY